MSTEAQLIATEPAKPEMSFGAFLATEGGRKCPACGRYAKRDELGTATFRGPGFIMTGYGHLPGFGCNREVEYEQD